MTEKCKWGIGAKRAISAALCAIVLSGCGIFSQEGLAGRGIGGGGLGSSNLLLLLLLFLETGHLSLDFLVCQARGLATQGVLQARGEGRYIQVETIGLAP